MCYHLLSWTLLWVESRLSGIASAETSAPVRSCQVVLVGKALRAVECEYKTDTEGANAYVQNGLNHRHSNVEGGSLLKSYPYTNNYRPLRKAKSRRKYSFLEKKKWQVIQCQVGNPEIIYIQVTLYELSRFYIQTHTHMHIYYV